MFAVIFVSEGTYFADRWKIEKISRHTPCTRYHGDIDKYSRLVFKIGIPKGMVFGPFGSENRFTLCPFWSGIGSEIRSGFGEQGGIPPPRNTRSTLCEDRHGAASLRENSLRNYPPYGWSKAPVSWLLFNIMKTDSVLHARSIQFIIVKKII